jgi:hypothetical protein
MATSITRAAALALILLVSVCGGKKEKPPGKEMFAAARSGLVVRKGPSASSERLGLVAYAGSVHVIGQDEKQETIDGKTGNWTKIWYKGAEAFVFGGFLSGEKPAAPAVPAGRPVATVITLQNADTACNVELQFENAGPEIWPADFSICQQQLQGKRIRFKTKKSKVMAASCQGDPSCTQSDEVDLIVSVEVVK